MTANTPAPGRSFRARIPWHAKILAKIVLSRLPIGYGTWRRMGLFRDGAMDEPEYALRIFRRHFKVLGVPDLHGKTVLELGPGDSVSSGIISSVFGAQRTFLVDDSDHVDRDLDRYRSLLDHLDANGYAVQALRGARGFTELLEQVRTTYCSSGLDSLRGLDSESVDFVFSNAVLEHVSLQEFDDVMRELWRVLKPAGVCSHGVDLKDHLNEALNNLRVPGRLWESRVFTRAGFYTNRIRYGEMLRRFEKAGFRVEVLEEFRWDALPTPPEVMQPEFRRLPEADLRIMAFDVILKKPGPT